MGIQNQTLSTVYTEKELLDSELHQTWRSDDYRQQMYMQAHLSPAFIFADDFKSVLSSSGSLHTLSDNSEVSIS